MDPLLWKIIFIVMMIVSITAIVYYFRNFKNGEDIDSSFATSRIRRTLTKENSPGYYNFYCIFNILLYTGLLIVSIIMLIYGPFKAAHR